MISPKGIALIKEFEGCRLRAYQDGGGVWTIGWGHTGPEVVKDLVWTQTQADIALADDIYKVEQGIRKLVTVPLTQGEYDALCSFAFNVGLDIDQDTKAEGLGDSTLLKKLNNSDYDGASAEFLKWKYDNGKEIAGLLRRRMAERELFESTT